jgi:hypothetical protein
MNETESLIKQLDKDDDSKILNDDNFSEIIWSEEFNWSVCRLAAGLDFEHVGQSDSIQISSRTWLFVRRIESNLICCSTFEFDSYRLFEILD